MLKSILKYLKNKNILLLQPLISAIYYSVRLLFSTYKIHITNPALNVHDNPGIYYFWHQDIIAGMYFFFKTKSTGYCVVSPSQDGRIIAAICSKLGFNVLYGSSHKNTINLLKNAINVLSQKQSLCLVGDGSRGPALQLQPGIAYLAKKTNTNVYFVSCTASRSIKSKKSWDNFIFPLPFSTITISIIPQTIESL